MLFQLIVLLAFIFALFDMIFDLVSYDIRIQR
jgi:hypothetical protein